MEAKWFVILMISLSLFTTIGLTIVEVFDKTALYAEQGLEECPNILSNYQNETVWVKDCNDFIKQNANLAKELNNEK